MSPKEINSPLIFEPIFMERIWGGRRLESEFHKKLPPNIRIGESWEIVDRPGPQSIVTNGVLRGLTLHELWTDYREEVFGRTPKTESPLRTFPRFPLLIKILDARENLSLQVHPTGEVASTLGGEPKSEFWYVAAADPGAKLSIGFRAPLTRDDFEKMLRDGTLIDHVHTVDVHQGDAVLLPAGRLHAVGAGNLLIEIQQNSDTTYRVFDWNRTDPITGKRRELHLGEAIQCIAFEDVQPNLIKPDGELLVSHSLFEIRRWNLDEPREAATHGQFAIVCCLTGKFVCADVELEPGQIFLLPAHLRDRQLKPVARETTLLRVTIPKL
ncbi:MAG: type I phosphomannose isomerase catalytic subunit [Alphaproteobacteria bacterium]